MDVIDADSLRVKVRQVVDEQERFFKDMQAAVAVPRDTKYKLAQGKAMLLQFAVGDFVLYGRVRRHSVTRKLMSTWTGPWRVVGTDHFHVYSVQNIVSGKVHTAHVARLRFYADADLNSTAKNKDVYQDSYAQRGCRINALAHVAEDDQGSVIDLVNWNGFNAEEHT